MSQELLLADFHGGMDASSAVDKLDQTACLLADGVRLDESGNVLSAGAVTAQNVALYTDTSGNQNIHSLFWNPSFGAVAGVGQDVYQGPTLGGMSRGLNAGNANQQKMSFASAPNRVYFDVGSSGYWTDLTNLLTVDWAPPDAASVTPTGPLSVATSGTATYAASAPHWTNPNGVIGLVNGTATTQITSHVLVLTDYVRGINPNPALATANALQGITVTVLVNASGGGSGMITFQAVLELSGAVIGSVRSVAVGANSGVQTISFGSGSDLWTTTLTAAQANGATLGVRIQCIANAAVTVPVNLSVQNVRFTFTQGSGTGIFAGTGAAGTLTGTYNWKVTFVAYNGEESDASSPSATVVLSAQQGTLTGVTVGDSRTASRNIYRKGGALTSFYLVGSIPDNATSTYSDNVTDISALATGVILSGDVPGDFPNSRLGTAKVRFPELHYDRTFWVLPGTNKIIWSKPLNGFAYPSVNFFNVGDGKPITRIVSKWGELIIFKTDSIWRLTGTDENSFSLSQTPSAVGTDLSFSILALPDGIRFANRWGLWIFNGYTSTTLTNKLDLWFKQDDRTSRSVFGINGMHPPEILDPNVPLGFEMVGNSEKIYWAYAEKNQSRNNSTLVFDAKRANITKRGCTGAILQNPLSLAIDPVSGFVYVGSSNGIVYQLDDFRDNPNSFANFDFQTGYITPQRGSNASLWALEFYINTNGQTITPNVYFDNGVTSETLATFTASGLQRVVRKIESSRAREMQNFSVKLFAQAFPVNSLGVPQIQLVSIKAYYELRVGRARTGQTV